VVLRARQRSQVGDEGRNLFERRLLVLLEIQAKPSGGEAALALGLFACDQGR
jgi:hypothetical protein